MDPRGGAAFDSASYSPGPWFLTDRLNVVRRGLRNPGQQVMELILVTSREIPAAEAEARLAELVPNLVRVGDDRQNSPAPR